jgi:predicted nucleic acid-binding protein
MTVYVETSAVLRWLFGEQDAEAIAGIIDGAESVVSSALTVLETQRAIIRAETQGLFTPADAERLRGQFTSSSLQWAFLSITESVQTRAGMPFPREPVRSLDAIHLATALELLQVYPDARMLSFDERIRENLHPLGIPMA